MRPDPPTAFIETAEAAEGAPASPIPEDGRPRLEEARLHGDSTSLQSVLRQRSDRLPRSKLQARSSLEHALLQGILTSPTFKTARKDIDTIFQEIQAQESSRKKAHLSRMQEVFRPDRIDWTHTAKKLLALTSVVSLSTSEKRLNLQEDFLEDHAGGVETNMWIHRVGTGAEVHLLPKAESNNGTRTVSLQGSPRSIELAEKALLLLQNKFQLSGTTKTKTYTGQGNQKGMVFSVKTFSSYVAQLVQHKLPRQVQQDTAETFHERVAAALVRVFLDPAASKYASSYAVQRALAFACQYHELAATVDTLYERTKHLGLKLDVNSFNHILRQAIARNNEEKVSLLLADMHKAGVSANGKTWVLFFTATQSDEARHTILSYMIQSVVNLTQRQRTAFAGRLAALRLREMKDSPDDFSKMLAELDHLFGKDWLNSDVYSRMVQAVNSRRKNKLRQVSTILINLPVQRGINMDQHVEIQRFALYRHQHSTEEATRELLTILQKDEKLPPKMYVAYVFMTAWDMMWPNVCRVLWRHAASHGNILYTMQSVVNRSLLNNTSNKNSTRDVWKRNAGSIVAGTDAEVADYWTTFPRLSKHCASLGDPMEWLTVYTPDDGTRDEQISVAYLILNRDLTAWKRHQPMTNKELRELLTLARQTDLAWKRDKLLITLPVSELLRQAVPVPLKSRIFHVGREDSVAKDGQQDREETHIPLDLSDSAADSHTGSLWSQLGGGQQNEIFGPLQRW